MPSVVIMNLFSNSPVPGRFDVHVDCVNDSPTDTMTVHAECHRSSDGHTHLYHPEPIAPSPLAVRIIYLFDHKTAANTTHRFTAEMRDPAGHTVASDQRVGVTILDDSVIDIHDDPVPYRDFAPAAFAPPAWLPANSGLLKTGFQDGYVRLGKAKKQVTFGGVAAANYPFTLAVSLRKRRTEWGKPETVIPLKAATEVKGGAEWAFPLDPAATHVESGDLIEFTFAAKDWKPLRVTLGAIDPEDKTVRIARLLKPQPPTAR